MTHLLSIIIPVLDEASVIEQALERVRAAAPEAELVVADGGSRDGTPGLAAKHARVVISGRGRALQMNRGARESSGQWLLFLHADTVPPRGLSAEIAEASRLGFDAGAFRLRIAGRHPLLPLLAWGANLRTRRRGIALGDQGLFVRRDLFWRLGGFPHLALMEDYAFALKLKRAGVRLYVSPLVVETSGRRWDELGFFRVWWRMRRYYLSYHWRGDTAALARGYRDVR